MYFTMTSVKFVVVVILALSSIVYCTDDAQRTTNCNVIMRSPPMPQEECQKQWPKSKENLEKYLVSLAVKGRLLEREVKYLY